MAPLSTHPFYIDIEAVLDKVAAASWELTQAAARSDGAAEWRVRLRKLSDDQLDILKKLGEVEDDFTLSTMKET